jgi:hypothetical protein
VLLSISQDEDQEAVRRFTEKNNIEWPQTLDEHSEGNTNSLRGTMAFKFNARALPKYFLIDKEGIVRYNSHLSGMAFVPENLISRYLDE